MSKDKKCLQGCNCNSKVSGCGCSQAVYGIGLMGALVYYFQHAVTFQAGLIGFLKALVWPAFLVYKAMELMGM